MTILAQLNDCHCCNDARSLVQKKMFQFFLLVLLLLLVPRCVEYCQISSSACGNHGFGEKDGWWHVLWQGRTGPAPCYRWIWLLSWTASSTNTWMNQPILPCQRQGCMQPLDDNGQLLVETYLRNIPMLSWRGTERFGRFFVLKRSFTVSLSLLDVLLGSRWCCGFVCFGFVSVFALCQSFVLTALQQLEISWSAIATKKKVREWICGEHVCGVERWWSRRVKRSMGRPIFESVYATRFWPRQVPLCCMFCMLFLDGFLNGNECNDTCEFAWWMDACCCILHSHALPLLLIQTFWIDTFWNVVVRLLSWSWCRSPLPRFSSRHRCSFHDSQCDILVRCTSFNPYVLDAFDRGDFCFPNSLLPSPGSFFECFCN